MGSFLKDCGADSPLILDVEGPGGQGVGRMAFPWPFALIGRDSRADLMLDHDLVSRRHGFLQIVEGRLFYIDLESRSGTTLGDSAVESGWLAAGQPIRIGPYFLRSLEIQRSKGTEGTAVPPNPLLARSSESTDLPKVALEFESRASGHSIWRMSQVMAVLGSSSRCRVRLYDPNVSKHHCILIRTPEALWAIDLLGRGGITINGQTVRFGSLGEGDVLGLGQILVRPTFSDRLTRSEGVSPWGGGISIGSATPALANRSPGRNWASPPATTAAPAPASVPMSYEPNGTLPAADTPPLPSLNAGEPALAMLLSHFGQMQQQMAEQFQQQMMMMMQMFNTMHREQMGLVREELDRLRELSVEVQSIKAQLATARQSPAQERPNWPNLPQPPRAPVNNPTPHSTSRPATANHSGGAVAEAENKIPVAPPDGATLNPVVHDWLNARLSTIQQEQKTRWQKIQGILGKKT